MNLFIPAKPVKKEYKKKRSKFISYIRLCNSKSEFQSWLSQIRKDHYDSSHICWAYSIFKDKCCDYHFSDSGEPSGSAGKPILNILKTNNLVQTGLVVVRYFGGIKLGRRGLIKSYQESAREVIDEKNFRVWILKKKYKLQCPIEFHNIIIGLIKEHNGVIITNHSRNTCHLVFEITDGKKEDLFKNIQLCTNKNYFIENI